MTDDYQASLEFLYGRLNYERVGMPKAAGELRLARMRRLLRRLGDPQRALRIVHVAGTKGKGSTSALIAAALSASGRRTGLFCSPHLHRLEERFRLDGRDATPDQLIALVAAVRPAVADLDAEADCYGRRGLTFFELTTAMGLVYFARARADAVVLEVGLGGRLDSTNAVRPVLSVLTSISFDHTRQLGNTLGAIAREKAGIIKRRTPCVSGVWGDEARAAIRRIADWRRSRLREVETDFTYRYLPPARPVARPEPGQVAVRTWRTTWGPLPLPLHGPHQAQNAAVALAALDVLADCGLGVDAGAVARGFANLHVFARFEILGERPWLVIDGAHNAASARALAATLEACMPETTRTLVFGTTREKDLEGQLRALLPLFDRCVATCYLENPRAVPPEEVAAAIRVLSGGQPLVEPDPAEALAAARLLTPPGGLICVTGSLFLAAETRAMVFGLAAPPAASFAAP